MRLQNNQKKREKKGPKREFRANLEGVQPKNKVLVPLSIMQEYCWDKYLLATITALADKGLELENVTFVIADRLQWHTKLMQTVAKRDALVAKVKKQIETEPQGDYSETIKSSTLFVSNNNNQLSQKILDAIQAGGDWVKVMDDGIEAGCKNKMDEAGQRWVSHVNKLISKLRAESLLPNAQAFFKNYGFKDEKLNYWHWIELTEQEAEFESHHSTISELYKKNKEGFAEIVDAAASAFVNTFIENYREECEYPENTDEGFSEFRQKLLDISNKYLLEESAAILLMMKKENADAMAYPFNHNATNHELYNCIKKLCDMLQQQQTMSDKKVMRPAIIAFEEVPSVKPEKSSAKEELVPGLQLMPFKKEQQGTSELVQLTPHQLEEKNEEVVVWGIISNLDKRIGKIMSDPNAIQTISPKDMLRANMIIGQNVLYLQKRTLRVNKKRRPRSNAFSAGSQRISEKDGLQSPLPRLPSPPILRKVNPSSCQGSLFGSNTTTNNNNANTNTNGNDAVISRSKEFNSRNRNFD